MSQNCKLVEAIPSSIDVYDVFPEGGILWYEIRNKIDYMTINMNTVKKYLSLYRYVEIADVRKKTYKILSKNG